MEGSSIITVVELEKDFAIVLLPDGSQEQWAFASRPSGVQEGSKIRLTGTGGDLEMEVLPTDRPKA